MTHLFPSWGWVLVAAGVILNVIALVRCGKRRDWHGVLQTLLQLFSMTLLGAGFAFPSARIPLFGAALVVGMCWAIPAARGRESLFDRRPAV